MKKNEPTTIHLTHMAEVDDLRHVNWNADWLKSAAKVWRLKPGEGVLYINRAHDRLRAVVNLGVPALVLFPVNKQRQSIVFAATVAALVDGKAVRLELGLRHRMAAGDWTFQQTSGRRGRIALAA